MLQKKYPRLLIIGENRLRVLVLGIFLFLFLIKGDIVSAQVLTKLENDFSLFNESVFKEKMYVQTDKDHYITGEILWFKTYCVESISNIPSELSKVAYIELLNANHEPVLQSKIELKKGIGNGSLYVPSSLKNGIYQLRSYTSWMKNFPAAYYFEKPILVINPINNKVNEPTTNNADIDINFFPEGGHLVQGVSSIIGFKIFDNNGKGLDGTGAIINQHNDTVCTFKTLKLGIGSFNFMPQNDMVYKAIIKANNTLITKSLPTIERSGLVLQAKIKQSGWHVKIQSGRNENYEKVYLLVHNSQNIEFASEYYLRNDFVDFDLEKSKLKDGLSYITVFDENRIPLVERVIFKRPLKKLNITANLTKPFYEKRSLVSISIETTNQNDFVKNANLSVAVTKNELFKINNENHINGYLWLNAVLKGQIESPDYYLDNNDDEANTALENLLLVQGWTQFDWSNIIKNKKPEFKFVPEYTGHIISGNITNGLNNKPAININAFLTIPGKYYQFYTSTTDSSGKVLFNTINNYAQGEIIVQTNFHTDSNFHFEINSPFSNQFSTSAMPAFKLKPNIEQNIINESVNAQVQNIFLNKKLKLFFQPSADSIPFFQTPSKTYLLDNYTRFTTIEEVLREYVSSIVISKHQGKFNIKMFDGVTPLNTQPLVLLDGLPLFDADRIFYVDPLKIKKLEVVTKRYLYGSIVYDGVLSFSTYNGDLNGFEIDPHAVVLDYDGLQSERKFYSPIYENEEQKSNRIPDFRNTLYWNPEITTEGNGKCTINFYTGDKLGTYTGIIEGITPNGVLGYLVFKFEVK